MPGLINFRLAFRLAGGVLCLAAVLPSPVSAQASPPADTRFLVGPLSLRPGLQLKDVGVDTNVFNVSNNPREDFSATLSPRLEANARVGSARISYLGSLDFVYFQRFKNEQSVNRSHTARVGLEWARVQPFVSATVLTTRDRLNTELDARARRKQRVISVGADVAITPSTTLVLQSAQSVLDFDDRQFIRSTSLRKTLNEANQALDLGLRFTLTPLTTVTLGATAERRDFPFSPERNSRTIRFGPTVDLRPSALIAGHAAVGYRSFTGEDAGLSDFRGIVAAVNLSYTAWHAMRLTGRFDRDLHYSFEEQGPYYLATGARLGVSQHLFGPIDAVLGGERQYRAYRRFHALTEIPRETVNLFDVGLGARIGNTARIGIQWEYSRRRSDLGDDRGFERRRILVSTDYGL